MNTAVIKRRNSNDEYTVSLRCERGETFDMRPSPDCEYDLENCEPGAAEGACLSGIAYAWRSNGRPEIDVKILRISGRSQPGYLEGFAIAALYAVACALGEEKRGLELVSKECEGAEESDEWEVVSPRPTE